MKSSKIRIMSACAAIAVLCAMLAGCSDHSETGKVKAPDGTEPSASITAEDTDEVKKAVYDYLDDFSKDIIIGTWEDGKISEIDLDLKTAEQYIPSENTDIKKYIGKTVYIVKFKTALNGLSGDVNVIADKNTGEIIAAAPLE